MRYTCNECGSTNVEICLPAWFRPNDRMRTSEADYEAEELSCYCCECEETVTLMLDLDDGSNGRAVTGRWD